MTTTTEWMIPSRTHEARLFRVSSGCGMLARTTIMIADLESPAHFVLGGWMDKLTAERARICILNNLPRIRDVTVLSVDGSSYTGFAIRAGSQVVLTSHLDDRPNMTVDFQATKAITLEMDDGSIQAFGDE